MHGIMLLSITDDGYRIWDDNVWVDYDQDVPYVENNAITVYRTVTGTKSYQTQAGGNTFVPKVHAAYLWHLVNAEDAAPGPSRRAHRSGAVFWLGRGVRPKGRDRRWARASGRGLLRILLFASKHTELESSAARVRGPASSGRPSPEATGLKISDVWPTTSSMTPDSPPRTPQPAPPAPDVEDDVWRVSLGALLGAAVALVAVVVLVVLLVVGHGSGAIGHASGTVATRGSGPSDTSAVATTWHRFVNLAQNPALQNARSDDTRLAALLAPNSPACNANCSSPSMLNLYTQLNPFKAAITDITVTGNSATATVWQHSELGGFVTQTVQFSKQDGIWQISDLPAD